jgi:hypothetical protein
MAIVGYARVSGTGQNLVVSRFFSRYVFFSSIWSGKPQKSQGPLTGLCAERTQRQGAVDQLLAASAFFAYIGPTLRLEYPQLSVGADQLPHRDGKPAQVGVSHQPDLPAREFQNGTFLVGKHNRADAAAERKARAGCAVDAGNVRRALDVTHPAVEHGPRSAEQQAVVYASDRERIAAAMEVQRAVAGRAADDPAALVDHERNAAGIGVCALETDAKQSDQRDQSASEQDRNSHGLALHHLTP